MEEFCSHIENESVEIGVFSKPVTSSSMDKNHHIHNKMTILQLWIAHVEPWLQKHKLCKLFQICGCFVDAS